MMTAPATKIYVIERVKETSFSKMLKVGNGWPKKEGRTDGSPVSERMSAGTTTSGTTITSGHVECGTLAYCRVPSADRDLVLLDGTEPNLRWRTFSEAIATAADALGVEFVVTLGALIAEVAHTLPVPITGLASSSQLVGELELERSNYEGPTGIVGIVHEVCGRTGIDSASLWAAVPHYVAAVPNPKAALALLRRLEGMTGIAVEASDLEEETSDYEEQIGRAVAANPEIEELVSRIEAEQADLLADEGQDLPSADSIAQEFQRFLRQRGNGS